MEYDLIIKYIDDAVLAYPSVKLLVITGGECFVLGDMLVHIVGYAQKKGLMTRIVTNAFWADSYESAKKRLVPLINAGLSEINFSTGNEHTMFVSLNNIVNAVKVSSELGIKNICISIESSDTTSVYFAYFKKNDFFC